VKSFYPFIQGLSAFGAERVKEVGVGEGIYVGNDLGSRDGISDGLDVGLAVGEVLRK